MLNVEVVAKCLISLHLYNTKHTNISSTDPGQGLCYYFFIVEVKEGRKAPFCLKILNDEAFLIILKKRVVNTG